jgi:dipeptidyl aminopeptidase/acylaminoacyl peptidase
MGEAVRLFAIGLIGFVLVFNAKSQNITSFPPTAPIFHQLSPHSMSISPDGRWAAFGRSSTGAAGDDLNMSFMVYDVARGTTVPIATYNYGSMNFGPRPVWSPNSDLLAYYAVEDETLRLKVWDRKHARLLPGSVPVDKAGIAELQMPQWTPDGRFVLCFSNLNPRRLWEEQEGDNYTARLRAELVGQRPATNGVTLLGTPALPTPLQRDYGTNSSGNSAGPPRIASRQVVALDVQTAATQVLARGAEFVQIQISDNGKVGLLGALDGSGDFLIYTLPLPSASPASANRAGPGEIMAAPVAADGAPLHLLFRSSAVESFQNFNLSPSGRYVAYLVEGSGDIVVVDLNKGTKTNLTAHIPPLVPDAPEGELQKLVGRFDVPLYKGKFGTNSGDAPVWTRDESTLLMRRVVAQLSVTEPQRVELWRVGRAGETARRLTQDATLSITSWADCNDRSRVNCVVGPEGAVMALVRKQALGKDGASSVAYVRIDATSGAVRMLRETSESTGSVFVAARATGDAVAAEEDPSHPQELWWVAAASVRSLDVLNPPPLPRIGAAQRLSWTSSSGERLFAMLRLPPGVRNNERLPILLSVYPGRRGLESSRHFDAGRYEPLRSRSRFALLTPDMPVKFGSGHVCADLARYANEALDAAIASGHVDGLRAGVAGISYGGYSVNCIITHSARFQAAVSEAGPADLASSHALGGRGEWNVTKSWQWETPDRIIDESPVYHLDKVRTPVLFVTGKTDLNNALQEYEMYFGLVALKQPAALVSYDKAGHGDYDRFPDFWSRVTRWFETYLKHSQNQ